MSTLIARELALYSDVWSLPQYAQHSPGEVYLPAFLDMAGIPASETNPGTVLDAGCGSGKGALALAQRGFTVTACDLTAEGLLPEAREAIGFSYAVLWHDQKPLGQFEYVYCCDVLEHIPTALTMLVVSRLLEVARQGVFLSISLMPDVFGAWVGTPLHQTVQPFTWWKEHLGAVGTVSESRDLLHCGLFYVVPRC